MGYSHYILARNPQLRDEMLEFLNSQLGDVARLHPALAPGLKSYWVDARVLGYLRGKDKTTALGFEAIALGDENRFFMYEILKWAAGKVGKTTARRNLSDPGHGDPDEKVPYVVYDGQDTLHADPIPDLEEHWRTQAKQKSVAAPFYRNLLKMHKHFGRIPLKELSRITQETLRRLETAWKKAERLKKLTAEWKQSPAYSSWWSCSCS